MSHSLATRSSPAAHTRRLPLTLGARRGGIGTWHAALPALHASGAARHRGGRMPRTGSVCAMQQAADNMHHPCDTRRAECAMCNGAYAQVRDKENGWLRGFITVTTFTTWHNDFRWDSLAPQSGMDDHCGMPSCHARTNLRTHARAHAHARTDAHGRTHARCSTLFTCAAPRVRLLVCGGVAASRTNCPRGPFSFSAHGTSDCFRGRHAVRLGRQPREAAELASLLRQPSGPSCQGSLRRTNTT